MRVSEMKKEISENVKKKFRTYVATTMFSSVLSSIYVSIDGVFIGQAVGDAGLTAVNIIWPIEALATSVARGIGLGGAICFAIALGKNQQEKACSYRGNTMILLLMDYLFMIIVIRFWYPMILRLLGATDAEVYRLAADYTNVYVVGCIFQILNCGIQPFLRNLDKPVHVMVYQMTGALLNVVLDYFFVMRFHWEVRGAGIATIVAESIACLLTTWSFLREKKYRHHLMQYCPNIKLFKEIIQSSISPMGASLCNSIVIIFNNRFCMHYGGVVATAAYSIVNYSYTAGYMFVMGVGEGIQPLISFNYGKRDFDEMNNYMYMGKKTVGWIGMIVTIIFVVARQPIAWLFGASVSAMEMVTGAICLSCTVFLLKGFVRLQSAYFNAINKNVYSNIIVYAESLLLTPLCLLIFTQIAGVDGVWITMPVVQVVLLGMGYYFERHICILQNKKEEK